MKKGKYSKYAQSAAKSLGNDVKEVFLKRMRERNLTQADLGKLMGKSRSNIGVLLTGEHVWSICTIIEFCKALDLKFSVFFTEDKKNVSYSKDTSEEE